MISPKEHQEVYQAALAWVGEQITAAERQGLILDYQGGWHTYKPNPKALERAWRVLYGIPHNQDPPAHLSSGAVGAGALAMAAASSRARMSMVQARMVERRSSMVRRGITP
jgi:hypothetical protein